MKTALLDLNLLTALLWPAHEHHDAAHRWFRRRGRGAWATCALTQLGFVRIVSNPAFSRDALTPLEGLALLGENLGHRRHEYWPDDVQVAAAVHGVEDRLEGYRQITNAYLLALAHRRKGVLASFDRGLRPLAGTRFLGALEIVATR